MSDDEAVAFFLAHGHRAERTRTGFRVRIWLTPTRAVDGEGRTFTEAVARAAATGQPDV